LAGGGSIPAASDISPHWGWSEDCDASRFDAAERELQDCAGDDDDDSMRAVVVLMPRLASMPAVERNEQSLPVMEQLPQMGFVSSH